jgi:hypothetical protein
LGRVGASVFDPRPALCVRIRMAGEGLRGRIIPRVGAWVLNPTTACPVSSNSGEPVAWGGVDASVFDPRLGMCPVRVVGRGLLELLFPGVDNLPLRLMGRDGIIQRIHQFGGSLRS